ncbi:MAG: TetR/AcrR family transcriptional regulator [Bacteroidales bacterium]|nr:TetR/AcrR family transcriptional regulator [Bacteroidales bacterium]
MKTEHKKSQKDTEERIISAAKKVFIEKGLDGARMQEIADEAEINKALLHYYFRSKDQLFEMVFRNEAQKFFPKIIPILSNTSIGFEERIKLLVKQYFVLLLDNPFLPTFIIRETNRNPEDLVKLFSFIGLDVRALKDTLKEAAGQMGFDEKFSIHLLINTVSMCVFPFAARPILTPVLFDNNSQEFNKFLEEREEFVSQFIIDSIKFKMSRK